MDYTIKKLHPDSWESMIVQKKKSFVYNIINVLSTKMHCFHSLLYDLFCMIKKCLILGK